MYDQDSGLKSGGILMMEAWHSAGWSRYQIKLTSVLKCGDYVDCRQDATAATVWIVESNR